MRILLIENDPKLSGFLKNGLTQQRYVVDSASDCSVGWDLMTAISYDLVLLDVKLPKSDAISFCHRLRSMNSSVPILLITARGTSDDGTKGLDAGADDSIAQPIDLNELFARIRALLRRGRVLPSVVLEWGALRLNPNRCEVTYNNVPLSLTPKEYGMLELLLRNNQRVYSRAAILNQLWSFDDELPGEDTVKAHIKGLRQKLRVVGAANLIETVYGLGYRLNNNYSTTTG